MARKILQLHFKKFLIIFLLASFLVNFSAVLKINPPGQFTPVKLSQVIHKARQIRLNKYCLHFVEPAYLITTNYKDYTKNFSISSIDKQPLLNQKLITFFLRYHSPPAKV